MKKLPEGLETLVDTLSTEDPVPPEVNGILEGVREAVTPVAAEGTEEVRPTVPENPRLARETEKFDDPPATTPAAVGDALIEKSGST